MIAIIKVGGHQSIVQIGDVLEVDKLSEEPGKAVSFEVLLVSEEDGSGFQIGDPTLKDIKVEAKILEHGRSKKIRVFKMKPRKRYRRLRGHKQDYTVIEITKIGKGTTTKKIESKTPPSEKKPEKTTKKTPIKKSPQKKTASTKPVKKK